MSVLLKAVYLLEVSLACFTISDVYLVEDATIGDSVQAGLRNTGDIYNPPAAGCNQVPCGLGTNNVPETPRLVINAESTKIGLRMRIENTSFAGKMGFEFRYGDNPRFAIGTKGFPLGTVIPIVKDADQIAPTATLTLTPSFTANATIQVYFIVDESNVATKRNSTIFYQCVDLAVTGKTPLPIWAGDFGPKEQANYEKDPTGTRGYDCSLDPRCRPYVPQLSDWDWLIILCVLSFLVLCVCLCIVYLCIKRPQKPAPPPPPEPAPVVDEAAVKEITPSGSGGSGSNYAHFAFTDVNDPPSKKADSNSSGDRNNTGSQGRHFHFHYEEAEEPHKDDKPEAR